MGTLSERSQPAAFDALLALSLGALLLLAAGAGYYRLSLPSAGARAVEIPGSRLQTIIGSAQRRGDSLDITGYYFQAMEYHAVAVLRAPLAVGDFAFLSYRVAAQFPGPDLHFIWREAHNPGEVHTVRLHRNPWGPSLVRLDGHPGWHGTVVELGVHAIGRDGGQALRIDSLRFEPPDWRLALAAQLSGWTAFRGWDHSSINYLFRTRAEHGISPLPVAGAWAALSAVLLWLIGVVRRRQAPAAYAAAALVPWMAIDLLWQQELSGQLSETRARFAGKTIHERHLADVDAWLYSYIQRLKAEVLPSAPARVFIMHDARKHHYDRLKAQYYLLPHNVYNFGAGPQHRAYRPGDYILIMRDTTDPVADEDGRVLRFASGHKLRVRRVDTDERGDLYRVREPRGARGRS